MIDELKRGLRNPSAFFADCCTDAAARPDGRAAASVQQSAKNANYGEIRVLAGQSSFHRHRVGGDVYSLSHYISAAGAQTQRTIRPGTLIKYRRLRRKATLDKPICSDQDHGCGLAAAGFRQA